jgi:hypothetical protein
VIDAARRNPLSRLRLALFGATGLAVPLYAFPPFLLAGRRVDLATLFAAALVLTSLPAVRATRWSRWESLWYAAAALIPLLVLLPPHPARFGAGAFAVSYAHCMLMVAFFACASTLDPSDAQVRGLIRLWSALGVVLALFALYQVVGVPRGWPLAAEFILPFQRSRLRLAVVDGFVRPTSLFAEPSMLGGFLVFVLGVGLARSWDNSVPRRRGASVAMAVALAVIFTAIVATISWGAFADLGALLLGLFLAARRSAALSGKRLSATLAGALVVLLLASSSPPGRRAIRAVGNRARMMAKTEVKQSVPKRNAAWKGGSSLWARYHGGLYVASLARRNPVGGIGLGQYRRYIPGSDLRRELHGPIDAWCGWLAVVAEAGVLGPLLIAGPLFLVAMAARGRGRQDWRLWAAQGIVVLAAVEQLHTASFIDLWWWYPVAAAALLAGRTVRARAPEAIDR